MERILGFVAIEVSWKLKKKIAIGMEPISLYKGYGSFVHTGGA